MTGRAALTVARPQTRGDCIVGPRPCPFVGCRHHLYLDVSPRGAIRLNFPNILPHEMADSCSLDVADRGTASLAEVGSAVNVTKEAIRLNEDAILEKLRPRLAALAEECGFDPHGVGDGQPDAEAMSA